MNTRSITFPQYKHIFYVLAVISALSLVLYVYAINQTVRNIIARQGIERQLSGLTSQIGEMEFTYIAKENSIDLAHAYTMGFKDVTANVFVTRSPSVAYAGDANIPR